MAGRNSVRPCTLVKKEPKIPVLLPLTSNWLLPTYESYFQSICMLRTPVMSHMGKTTLTRQHWICRWMDLQNCHFIGHLSSDRYAVLTRGTVPTSTGARGPGRVCLLEPGTGTDGSPNLKPPKWLSCFDLGIPLSFGSRLEIGYVASMVHSIFIKRFTKARQNKRKKVKGTEAKGLPRHVRLKY